MASASPSTQLIQALEEMGPHDHLCSIYENREERFAVVLPFMRIGLERGEKCIYIADDGALGDIRAPMEGEGIDVDGAIDCGALVLTTKEETYLKHGSFNPEWMFAFWREAAASAASEGFSTVRAAGETEWVLRGGPGLERWMEYESRLTHTLGENNCFALCQYSRRLFPPELILDVIRTHPIVIYQGTVCRNLYHVPPDEFLGADRAALEVDRLLSNIREREQLDCALREQQNEIRLAYERLVEDGNRRKRAEEDLRRSEAYLAEGQRLSHTGSWGWNASSRKLFWSREVFRIFGLEPGTIEPSYQMVLDRWVHTEDRPGVDRDIEAMTAAKKDGELDYRIVRDDGSVRHLHGAARPIANRSGDAEFVGVVIDVTERHQARADLESAFAEIKALKDRLYHENLALREDIDRASMFDEIIGASPAVRTVLSRVAKVSPTDSTVLITGETGTGKELIARAIHKRSRRAGQPFIGFNCAGIPPALVASELFGHEKGSFTGAQQRRLGRFELAAGGTIFLDQVGELPAETQIALLRGLQEREFERIGGNRLIRTDVRVITPTNRNLQDAIAA